MIAKPLGGLMMLGGLAGLAVAIYSSFESGPEGPGKCVPFISGLVTFEACQLDVNAPFVVNVRRNTLFSKEREALASIEARLQKAREKASASGAQADVKLVQTLTTEADALPRAGAVALFVDGEPAPARAVVDIASELSDDLMQLRFVMSPVDDGTGDASRKWRALLAGSTGFGERTVAVGIGKAGDEAPLIGSVANDVLLTVFRPWVVKLGGVGLLLFALGLVVRNWNTPMLRDGAADAPFSLSRLQAFWWGLIIIGGFVFVALATRQFYGVVTSSAIGLIGISGVTFLAARGIDQMEPAPAGAPPASAPPAPPAPALPRKSAGFLADLITDPSGDVAVQRVQMVAWNLVLGLIFVVFTLRNLSFPEFDSNLLILAGLVSATYAGFKLPENSKVSENRK